MPPENTAAPDTSTQAPASTSMFNPGPKPAGDNGTPPAAAGQTPATSVPANQAPAPAGDLPEWLKGVDPEIVNDPSLKVFKNQQELIKSYVHAQRALGNKVAIPGKNATDQDWKQFYGKIGMPEALEAYELKKGENYSVHDDALNEFKQLAFENNLLPGQAQKVMDWLNGRAQGATQAQVQKAEQEVVEGWSKLKTEWGAGFEKHLDASKAVFREFGDDETIEYFEKKGFFDDPKLAKFFAKIGSNLTEDKFNEDVRGSAGMTPQEAKSRYQEIINDANSAYRNSSHPNHKEAVKEVNKLFEMM